MRYIPRTRDSTLIYIPRTRSTLAVSTRRARGAPSPRAAHGLSPNSGARGLWATRAARRRLETSPRHAHGQPHSATHLPSEAPTPQTASASARAGAAELPRRNCAGDRLGAKLLHTRQGREATTRCRRAVLSAWTRRVPLRLQTWDITTSTLRNRADTGLAQVIKHEIAGPAFSLSLTPIHSLRHRLVRSRQYALPVALGFLRF